MGIVSSVSDGSEFNYPSRSRIPQSIQGKKEMKMRSISICCSHAYPNATFVFNGGESGPITKQIHGKSTIQP